MATRSDSSLREIWDGQDGPFMSMLMRVGTVVISALVLAYIMTQAGIKL